MITSAMVWANDDGYVEHDMTTGLYKVYDNYGALVTECRYLQNALDILKDIDEWRND